MRRGAGAREGATQSPAQAAAGPGKRTLTERLEVPHAAPPGAGAAARATAAPALVPAAAGTAGAWSSLQMLFGGPRAATAATDPAQIRAIAARGTATPATTLPYADQIQRAFGHHDVRGIQAHVGGDATAAAHEIGATAYAHGEHVVLGPGADLRVVAHEAAHVVQQRGGAAPAGGIGVPGDAHEQHADEVAALVGAGQSAEAVLDRYAKPGTTAPATAAPVQRDLRTVGDFTKSGDNYQWQPHVTNAKPADGNQPAVTKPGLGTHVDGAKTAQVTHVAPIFGAPHATTKEATSAQVARLGPTSPAGADPAGWTRPDRLGKNIKDAAGVKHAPVYETVQLLPTAFGGAGGRENLVALPKRTGDELVAHGHDMLARLVTRAGAWVAYHASVTTDSEKLSKSVTVPPPKKVKGAKATTKMVHKTIEYTATVKVVWHELDEQGNEVPGTRGKFEVRAPEPSKLVASKTASLPTSIKPNTKGAINRADAPADRDDRTAITWRTVVSWGDTHPSGDGTTMEATRLGPDHLQGTQPAHRDKKAAKGPYVWDKRTAKMKSEAGRPYIAGHLLNHHVGGPGNDARNLVAIPADMNSKMETDVEDPVKELVNKQRAWIYYRAEATHKQDSGGNNKWYVSNLKFRWHQLDQKTGEAVPGTEGKASYVIDEPSAIDTAQKAADKAANKAAKKAAKKSGKKAKTVSAPSVQTFKAKLASPAHADAQAATATTTPAFNEVILEDASTLRPILVYQTHLLKVLEKMQLNPHFHQGTDAELVNHLANVFAAHKPGKAESGAWATIGQLDTKLAALDPTTLKDASKLNKRAIELETALVIASKERQLRTSALMDDTRNQLQQMYNQAFATTVWGDFETGLKSYDDELKQAEHLIGTLVEVAKKSATGVVQEKTAILDAANQLRAWLGKPALDNTVDTTTLGKEALEHAGQIGNESFDYARAPGSPGQFFDEGMEIAKATSQPRPTTLYQSQSLIVRDANQNRKRPHDVAMARPASNTKQRLRNLLQTHAATWPASGTGHAYDAYAVHAQVCELARMVPIFSATHEFVGTIIDRLYSENVDELRRYVTFVEGNPPT